MPLPMLLVVRVVAVCIMIEKVNGEEPRQINNITKKLKIGALLHGRPQKKIFWGGKTNFF